MAGKNRKRRRSASAAIENGKLIARALDCACLFVHHPGKDEFRGARGSYVYKANVDTMWHVERNGMTATLDVEKQKDGEIGIMAKFDAHIVRTGILDRNGNERTSLVATEAIEKNNALPGETITRENADLATIAALLRVGDRLSLRRCAMIVCGALGCKERSAQDRIKAGSLKPGQLFALRRVMSRSGGTSCSPVKIELNFVRCQLSKHEHALVFCSLAHPTSVLGNPLKGGSRRPSVLSYQISPCHR